MVLGNQIDESLRTSNRYILNSEGSQVSYPVLRKGVAAYRWSDGNTILIESSVTDLTDSDLSNEQIVYLVSPVDESPTDLRLEYTDTTTENIKIEDMCQGRYEHTKLTFVNRLGAFQDVWFFANAKSSLKIKDDSWNRRNLVSQGGAYRPTTVKNITAVNERHTLNSGFYPESNNVVFEELIQAQNVWITKGIETFPILIKNTSFNFKDSNTDKAINYTINFEYAFNKMKSL